MGRKDKHSFDHWVNNAGKTISGWIKEGKGDRTKAGLTVAAAIAGAIGYVAWIASGAAKEGIEANNNKSKGGNTESI